MPSTPNLALPYPAASDTADVPRDIQALAVKLDVVAGGPVVTSLPGSPVDGQEVYYVADATNGVVYHLRYRSAASGSYKWEVVGGSDLWAGNNSSESGIAVTTYGNTVPNLQLTLPLAGDYLVSHGAYLWNPTNEIFVSYNIAAANSSDADAVVAGGAAGSATCQRMKRQNAMAAGTVLNLQRRVAGGSAQLARPFISARPIRVG